MKIKGHYEYSAGSMAESLDLNIELTIDELNDFVAKDLLIKLEEQDTSTFKNLINKVKSCIHEETSWRRH